MNAGSELVRARGSAALRLHSCATSEWEHETKGYVETHIIAFPLCFSLDDTIGTYIVPSTPEQRIPEIHLHSNSAQSLGRDLVASQESNGYGPVQPSLRNTSSLEDQPKGYHKLSIGAEALVFSGEKLYE